MLYILIASPKSEITNLMLMFSICSFGEWGLANYVKRSFLFYHRKVKALSVCIKSSIFLLCMLSSEDCKNMPNYCRVGSSLHILTNLFQATGLVLATMLELEDISWSPFGYISNICLSSQFYSLAVITLLLPFFGS